MTDTRHAAAEKITRNLPGLERRGRHLQLRGVGLLELTEQGYRVSLGGVRLAETYRRDPKGEEWVRELARLLLASEPRSRLLVRCLSAPGAVLRFDRGWFEGAIREARIEGGAEVIAPFLPEDGAARSLRGLLEQDAWWSLGAWRQHELLAGASGCRFVGTLQERFSLHDVGLALRGPLEALLHLGALRVSGPECTLDADVASRLFGPEMAEEFGWERAPAPPLIEVLARLVAELRSDTGYVVASELRAALRRQGVAEPDREIARLVSEGRVLIDAEDYGQSRHGEGLFGEPRKQLVKLRVEAGGQR